MRRGLEVDYPPKKINYNYMGPYDINYTVTEEVQCQKQNRNWIWDRDHTKDLEQEQISTDARDPPLVVWGTSGCPRDALYRNLYVFLVPNPSHI